MEKIENKKALGNTGLMISELCFGVLPLGPLQMNLTREDSVALLQKALELGVNFFDTAEMYKTQTYLGEAFKGQREQVIIASKSMAETYDDMARSMEKSLKELDTNYIDIYHLHIHKLPKEVLQERKGVIKFLEKMKVEKVIKHIGIATHNPDTLVAGASRDDIDVIFALINKKGLGIVGSVEDMLKAINYAYKKGKGLYAMKVLGGGNLIPQLEEAFRWVRSIEGIASTAVGIISQEELMVNLSHFNMLDIDANSIEVKKIKKQLFIVDRYCKGCGNCIDKCPNDALSLVEGKAKVDHSRCLLCAYCGPECKDFAIRIV